MSDLIGLVNTNGPVSVRVCVCGWVKGIMLRVNIVGQQFPTILAVRTLRVVSSGTNCENFNA